MVTLEVPYSRKWFATIPLNVKSQILLSGLITAISILVTTIFYFRIQPVIPLFYTLADPIAQLAPKEWLFFFPFLASIITLIHIGITIQLRHYGELVTTMFAWTTVVVQALLLLSLVRVLSIVT